MKSSIQEAVALLSRLIATPSHTREEGATADLLGLFFEEHGLAYERVENNLILCTRPLTDRPTRLLNCLPK